jgi:hypothetical protein
VTTAGPSSTGIRFFRDHHLERIIAATAAHDQALSELRKGARQPTMVESEKE